MIGLLPLLLSFTPAVRVENLPWLYWALWLLLGFGGLFPLIVAYIVWAERKAAARFQDRIGPNRVGPFGLLQSIADLVKLLSKEDFTPAKADVFIHALAPVLMLVSVMLSLAVIPFGFGSVTSRIDPISGQSRPGLTGFCAVDLAAGLPYLVAVASIGSLGLFLAGWSSRNKYALLGSMRSVAQMVSYEIPQVMATLPVVLWAGSLSLTGILDRQVESGWFLFSPPGALAFIIFFISSLAEVNRAPFDLPEAESELVAGFHIEYSSMKFALFFMAEYMGILSVSSVATTLYLGGGSLPFTSFPRGFLGIHPLLDLFCNLFTILIFSLKVIMLIFVFFWVRATLPRMRVDRLMAFAWKFLIPLSIANIVVSAIWFEMIIRPGVPPAVGPGLVGWCYGFVVCLALELAALVLTYFLYRTDSAAPVASFQAQAHPGRARARQSVITSTRV